MKQPDNPWLSSITWGDKWKESAGSPITFSFPESYDDWSSGGKASIRAALNVYAEYLDIHFKEVASGGNLQFHRVDDAFFGGPGWLAAQNGPHGGYYQGQGYYNQDGIGWSDKGMAPGNFGFMTIIHELGHGLGLAHPHDNGGSSAIMPGVTDPYDLGDYGNNSPLFTVMSYKDDAPNLPGFANYDKGYGWVASPMALDVAVLQSIYGANPNTNKGNTVYKISATLGAGNVWKSIWDTGGIDTIRYTGAGKATIDLRDAELSGKNAGGYLSRASSSWGGFVICAGAVIEQAIGGAGADLLIGNEVNNLLVGNAGNDVISGGVGDDKLSGGSGADHLIGGIGNDTYYADKYDVISDTTGNDRVIFDGSYTLAINLERLVLDGAGNWVGHGNSQDNAIYGNIGKNVILGLDGEDRLLGEAGNDSLNGGAGNDVLSGGAGSDTLVGSFGSDILVGGLSADSLYGDASNDTLYGEDGDDRLYGGYGDDLMSGGAGLDVAWGGIGNDQIFGGAHNDTLSGDAGDDRLVGDDGVDRLYGGDGNDTLSGGVGGDLVKGHAGDDVLCFINGGDTLYGGAGDDIFNYRGIEVGVKNQVTTIEDFSAGDILQLISLDANTKIDGNQAFDFIGGAAFSKTAGELRFDAAAHSLSGDVNGDGYAEFTITLVGVNALDPATNLRV
ncbi:M10 family metallopeptidase C-terminal domain-containing protein [Lacibacterium aquatile]|uniref:M10 family metallopeptidase C-terminal domain-containing protein n=1 Tax=Lacibacterium aquatile TaxID=1168082 RepID=A0ABW5DUK5_9PROT